MADSKEYLNQLRESGSINISEEVVATISALAAVEVSGVGSLGAGGIAITELLGMKSLSKGVKVEFDGDKVIVDVYMTVKYGEIVPDVAVNVQDAVVSALESMANLTKTTVNVHITSVVFEKDEKKDKK